MTAELARVEHVHAVDLDALFPPLALTDADGAMADLGLRLKSVYRGAATTPQAVRAIREAWEFDALPWWHRLARRAVRR